LFVELTNIAIQQTIIVACLALSYKQ